MGRLSIRLGPRGRGSAALRPAALLFGTCHAQSNERSPMRSSQSTMMIKLSMAVAAAMFGAIGSAGAQSYPSRPITMLVGYAVGGPSDTIARIMADRMKVALGQPVIIENVTGAAGSLAVGRGARAAPGGYK